MSICKETGRTKKSRAEVCNILFSGCRISAATLTPVFTGQIYAVGRQLRVSVFRIVNQRSEGEIP
jgi:hypothetical protein